MNEKSSCGINPARSVIGDAALGSDLNLLRRRNQLIARIERTLPAHELDGEASRLRINDRTQRVPATGIIDIDAFPFEQESNHTPGADKRIWAAETEFRSIKP